MKLTHGACKLFHQWSGWANMGGNSDEEYRLCNKCGASQTRPRK